MRGNSLRSGMFRVFIANLISLIFGLLTNFILPKYLSVDSYAGIKTFQLYITYIGILHFGYEDGMYLKYGGKRVTDISSKDISENLYTLRVFQLIISLVVLIVSVILRNYILLVFAFAILPVNLVAYYKLLFQAVGEFKRYGKILNLTSIVTFILNAILVFVAKTDNYMIYIVLYVVWDVILWLVLEISFRKLVKIDVSEKHFSFSELKENINNGIPLTLGNFSSVLLTSIDRWFVKLFQTTSDFAYYSFAVSTESFINVALTPITVTLYNYFCNHKNKKDVIRIRNAVILFSVYVVSCGFGAKFIINLFVPKYNGSICVMFILFASQICYVTIKGVYVNIYKAQGRQKQYFSKLLVVVAFGVVMNILFFILLRQKEVFALATLLSSIFWLVLCIRDHNNITLSFKEWLFIVASITLFILCGIYLNAVAGFIIYVLLETLLGRILMKDDQKYLFKLGIIYLGTARNKIFKKS